MHGSHRYELTTILDIEIEYVGKVGELNFKPIILSLKNILSEGNI